jgi:hypothetical protein
LVYNAGAKPKTVEGKFAPGSFALQRNLDGEAGIIAVR